MTSLLAKVRSVLAWLWSWVKWADAKFMAAIVPATTWVASHIGTNKKQLLWVALGGFLAGYFLWASVRDWVHEMRVALAPVPHVQSVPEGFVMPGVVVPTAMPAAPRKEWPDLEPLKPIVVSPPAVPAVAPATVKPVAPKRHVVKRAPAASVYGSAF